jgi:hypothetical protein
MEPSVGTLDDIPQGSGSQSKIGAKISTILSDGSICDHSGRESTSLNKSNEGGGERDCENNEVAKVYVDVLIDTVRRMSLLPSDMLAMKFRWVTAACLQAAPACPPARTDRPPPPPGRTLTTDSNPQPFPKTP